MIPLLPLAAVGAALLMTKTGESNPVTDEPAPANPANPDYSNEGRNHPLMDNTHDSRGEPLDFNQGEANVQATLEAIRLAESGGDYGALVGGGSVTDLSTHPAMPPRNWKGIRTSAGPSHAAGAYQFQPGTWRECAAALGLHDFGEEAQDKAAVFLIKRRGAYDDVFAGRFSVALLKLRNEWASIGARGDQWYAKTFTDNGGALA